MEGEIYHYHLQFNFRFLRSIINVRLILISI